MYLIDSDILIYLSRGRTQIQQRMSDVGISNCFLSEISLAELYVGVYKGIGKESFIAFLEKNFTVLPITPALKTFAQIKAQLEAKGASLDKMDLFIAATALTHGYTLVTHNTRHFSRIPELKLEDWLTE
jgi:tRNA(fMet)-specific endonuclease VapC